MSTLTESDAMPSLSRLNRTNLWMGITKKGEKCENSIFHLAPKFKVSDPLLSGVTIDPPVGPLWPTHLAWSSRLENTLTNWRWLSAYAQRDIFIYIQTR